MCSVPALIAVLHCMMGRPQDKFDVEMSGGSAPPQQVNTMEALLEANKFQCKTFYDVPGKAFDPYKVLDQRGSWGVNVRQFVGWQTR